MLSLQRRIIVFALLLTALVVVLGAYTRLVDAGLGCPDWPTCYGHFWVPKTDVQVEVANLRFAHAPVEHDKTWPEQTHRIVASSLGLLLITIAGMAWYLNRRQRLAVPVKHPLALVVLVICQGLFGMWTVTLLLWPQVVTAHLLGGFATLALLFLLWLRVSCHEWLFHHVADYHALLKLRPLLAILLLVVLVQIFLGGWTAANYAAVACADFPKCHNQWWPAADFTEGFNFLQQIGPNYLGGQLDNHARTAIHLAHRIGAIVTLLFCVITVMYLLQINHRGFRASAWLLLVVVFIQLALGISNIVFALPLPVAVAHNAMAAVLLLAVIYINYRMYTVRLIADHEH